MLLIHYSINNQSHKHRYIIHFSDKENGVNKQMYEPFMELKSHYSLVAPQVCFYHFLMWVLLGQK